LKIYLIAVLLLFSKFGFSQCLDVFNRSADCPTENDSLVVYNNAQKVYEFYEQNPNYVKLKSVRIKTKKDVLDCFYQLENSVDSFTKLTQLRERLLNGENLPTVLLPRNGKNLAISDYYIIVDAYRFYQREFENGILNVNSPFPIYDIRISPLLINTYENRSGYDEYNGDFVNVALYIPVAVKPYRLLTDSEKVIRTEILRGNIPKKILQTKPKREKPKRPTKPENDLPLNSANLDHSYPSIPRLFKYTTPPSGAIPMYYVSGFGGGHLMGYMVGRKFRKFLPTDEFYWSVPKWLKDFLNDDKQLETYLKTKLGDYYNGFYK